MVDSAIRDHPRRIVIAGGSIAGLSAARELRRAGFDGTIDLVDQDPHAPYRRPAVSKAILTGDNVAADVAIEVPDGLGITRSVGVTLRGLDVRRRIVFGERDGEQVEYGYDGLVIATGCEARPWELHREMRGVHVLRHLADGLAMHSSLVGARHVVIVGAGFIGLEVASVCRSLDIDVTVVETAAIPLSRVLGASLGGHLADLHRDTGVRILCGTSVVGLHGRDAVESVTLSSGETVETDLILACVGSRPATDWLESSGLSLRNGVLADHRCVVDAEAGIVAAGDVASWHNPLYGRRMRVEHWANAIEQGGFAARALLGTAAESGLSSVPYFWSEQLGSRLQSVGSAQGHDEVAVLEHDGDTMVVAYRRDERLVAVAGIHAGSRVLGYRAKIESRIPFRSVLDDRVASRA